MPEQTKTRIPAPLYAVAGAGDFAYEQLRKLPAVIDDLSGRAGRIGEDAGSKAGQLRDKAATTDFDKLRDTATNNALAFAQVASERAIAVYTALVARGERVVGTGVIETADVVQADITTTEATTETPAVEAAAATEAAKPRKRVTTKATPAKVAEVKNADGK